MGQRLHIRGLFALSNWPPIARSLILPWSGSQRQHEEPDSPGIGENGAARAQDRPAGYGNHLFFALPRVDPSGYQAAEFPCGRRWRGADDRSGPRPAKSGVFSGRIFPTKSKIRVPKLHVAGRSVVAPLDECADIYSLGCTFYELVAGKPPFTGTNSSELLKKHLKASPPPLEAIHENVTHEFSQLIHRVMAKQPAVPAASSQEFYSELQMTVIFRQTPAA